LGARAEVAVQQAPPASPVLVEVREMKRFVIGALFAISVSSAPAVAQGVPLVHFGVMGGYALPYSNLKDYANSGWNAGVTVKIGAPLVPVAFRVDATYSQMNGKTLTLPGPTTVDNDFMVWNATGNVEWVLIGKALPTQFYLIGGLGYYNVQQKVNVTSPVNVSTPYTSSKFGYNAGLGVRFTKLFVEARWNTVSDGLVTTSGSKTTLEYIPITVGIIF
jgi:opacity protein-like surface antigen